MKTIMCYGIFDLLHFGHIRFLLESRLLGDRLIVGVLSDELAQIYKRKPIINEKERISILEKFNFVDKVIRINEKNYESTMSKISPDIVTHGDDNSEARSIKTAKKLKIETKILKYTKGISTTEIIERCKNATP